MSTAVVCFFTVSLIGWASHISPFTCCKRAMTTAFAVYVVAALAVKAINAILINAMIKSQINRQQEENAGDGGY
jgi:hypothetical protein